MTDFLLWLYYTMAGINKIVNKKDFCARLKNIIYLLSVYILYRLLILHAPPLPPLRGEVSAKLTKGGYRAPFSLPPSPLAYSLHGEGAPVLKPGRMRSSLARARARFII